MADRIFIEYLTSFGLTNTEAQIYFCLLEHDEMTGYEITKASGISRSNVYSGLGTLVEKGGAYLIEGETSKYTAVELKIFVANFVAALTKKAEYLLQNAPALRQNDVGYITISGSENIKNKIRQMMNETQSRLYVMASEAILENFIAELENLASQGKKIVILTENKTLFATPIFREAKIYCAKTEKGQIRLITDSSFVLTGELTENHNDTCLYSGQKNLVTVMKEALKNEIKLLEANV